MSKKNYIPLENQPSDTISAGITITFDDEKKTSDPLSLSSSDSVTINYQNNNHNNNDDYNNNDDELPITVVVTGASGFVASYIIKELLESPKHKYKVIGTVRRPTSNYEWLHTVVDPKKKIRGELILKQVAPLEKEDAYQDLVTIISDADYVLHVASPYVLNPKNVYNDLLKPAISGTENVLNACKTVCNQQRMKHKAKLMSQSYDVTTSMRHNKKKGKYRKSRKHGYSQHSQENSMNGHGGGGGGGGDSKDSNGNDNNNNDGVKLKRVVITSSMAAITDSPIKRYTETDWNLMSSEIRNAYFYSKTEAEKCAWRWMYKYGNIKNWDQLKLVEFDIKFEGNATPITPCSDKDKVPFDLCVVCLSIMFTIKITKQENNKRKKETRKQENSHTKKMNKNKILLTANANKAKKFVEDRELLGRTITLRPMIVFFLFFCFFCFF